MSAKVEASVALTCSRCLKSFPYPLRIAIEEEYLPTIDINSGQSLRMTEGAEGSFTIDQRHILDLREAIRQYSITNQPMKPLCSRDCRGLCPVCGTDRSEDHCSCQGAPIDPRLLPLLELRECDGD